MISLFRMAWVLGRSTGFRSPQSSVSSCWRSWVLPGIMPTFRRSTGYISETWDLSSLVFCFGFYFKLLITSMISTYGNTYPDMLSVLRTFPWCWCQLVQNQPSPNSYSTGQKRPKGGHIQIVYCSWPVLIPESRWVHSWRQPGPKAWQKLC